MDWLSRIIRIGQIAEPALAKPVSNTTVPRKVCGSLHLRHVDAGSCNACEIELTSVFGPVYDVERYGIHLVASPRHADGLLVTGAVTRNMLTPLRNVFEAIPHPRLVIACGDCAINCGILAHAYGIVGPVRDVIPVDLEIPGCPPDPHDIINALRSITGR